MKLLLLSLLLLGTAIAAPIQDLAQTSKCRDDESLVSRGLVPVLPRNPVRVAPKPIGGPKPAPRPPASGPDAPGGLRPPGSAPIAPGNAPDSPGRLRPNDPAKPQGNTQPGRKAPTNNPVNTHPPATKPDNTKPSTTKADEDPNTPVRSGDDIDGPVNLPEICDRGKRCLGTPPAFDNAPLVWTTTKTKTVNGVEIQVPVNFREEGWKSRQTLEQVVTGKRESNPPKFNGDLMASNRYKVDHKTAAENTIPDNEYLKDPRWADAFAKNAKWKESRIWNKDSQISAQREWVNDDFWPKLVANEPKQADENFPEIMLDMTVAPIVRTFENPQKGSMIVKASFNNEKDLYRPYKFQYGEKKLWYDRPAFGNKADEVGWTDQMMANWRKSAGDKVKDLRYIAQDDITTHSGTREVIDGVYEAMGKKQGEMITLNKPKDGEYTPESASYDALAGTVHAQRPIQMATDHHVELGNPTVEAIHVLKTNPNQYDMIVEFGRSASAPGGSGAGVPGGGGAVASA